MAMDMRPQPEDTAINIPVTFDYRGGKSANVKGNVIAIIIFVLVPIIVTVGIFKSLDLELWQKFLYSGVVLYVGLFLIRFFILKETYYSDVYETLKAKDFRLKTNEIWQIFDIDSNYPYISYFRNGYKGIFVKMEKDVITGKPETAMYDHYEAIADAYNVAHSLNMNIIHIDYMDNIGNDPRLQTMYDDLAEVSNMDMQDLLIDIYSYLQDNMSMNYASFDIYLFLTRDNLNNFTYNVQSVVSRMLGGNFITYKILDRNDISSVCTALFNLHDFSVFEACENVLQTTSHSGIIPISVIHPDGTEDKLNKTQAEKRAEAQEKARKQKEALQEAEREKQRAKLKKKGLLKEPVIDNTELDIFMDTGVLTSDMNPNKPIFNDKKSEESNDDEDIDLFG